MPLSDDNKREIAAWLADQEPKRGCQLWLQYIAERKQLLVDQIVSTKGEECDFEKGEVSGLNWILGAKDRLSRIIVSPKENE